MGSPFQQRARQRKLWYIGLILVLFTFAWFWRHRIVDDQAHALALREVDRGEVELTGAAVRLGLTGMRGAATCVLWTQAIDKQKKNQWNELEVLVRSLTKLQPHFITPWLFQSWNLAYNVSVESDRVRDKFFYVSRGVELLGEGERQNRDHPDLRWSIGFYTQHKVCQSDETNTMRSLFQLSCMPPNERDPARFWIEDEQGRRLNLVEFARFCEKHPQLARRLRQGMHRDTRREKLRQFTCETPEAVVEFFRDNFNVPSLYHPIQPAPVGAWQEKPDRLRAVAERFPILPPPPGGTRPAPNQHVFNDRFLTTDSDLTDEVNGFAVAQAWYGYAQEPIPDCDDLPGSSKPIVDRAHQRRPRHMTTLIFRNYPAQGQRYIAERLQQEGWYDDTPWDIPGWFEANNDRFPAGPGGEGKPARVSSKGSLEAWQKAFDLWQQHGLSNLLLFSDHPPTNAAKEQDMRALANQFYKARGLDPSSPPPELREERLDPQERERYRAAKYMREYQFYRGVSNFPHHYHRSIVEAREETVQARRLFYEAESLSLSGSPQQAIKKYEDPRALRAWRDKILLPNRDFRRDDFTQEQTAEIQLRYLDLHNKVYGSGLKKNLGKVAHLLPLVPAMQSETFSRPVVQGPFDVSDPEGGPLVSERAFTIVRQRYGLTVPTPTPAPEAGSTQGRK